MRIFAYILLLLIFNNPNIGLGQDWQSFAIKTLNHTVNGLEYDQASQQIIIHTKSDHVHTFDGYTFSNKQLTSTFKERNPVDSLTIGPISDTLTIDHRQYFATINNGLWIKQGQRIKQFTIEGTALPTNILAIESLQNILYILTTKNTLFAWDDRTYALKEMAIPKTEYISDLVIDEWDQLWLLGEESLFRDDIYESAKAPLLNIIDIKSSFESIELPWNNLSFDSEQVVLSFSSGAQYLKGSDLMYQYTLKNDTWSPMSPYPQVNLTDLAPGDYEFQMRAKSKTSELGYSAVIPFTVSQSFINSQWPWLIGGIGGLFLLWGFSFNRQNQELKTIQNSANKYRLENQLLKSKQETQQLQMNPHFLFNSLNTIQGTIAQGDTKKARHLLNQYAQLMRSLLDQSREDEISIKDEIQFLIRYLELEQAARNHKFEFTIKIDETLAKETSIPPMIIQPILENAIIHGMKGISKTGEINIGLKETKNGIQVVVDDNGIGRDNARKEHNSHGLSILTERIRSYSTFKSLNEIKIIDKIENGKPSGTTVILELPKL